MLLFDRSERSGSLAPVLLCLPAMGVAARFYAHFADALAESTAGTAVLVDLRGQGASPELAARGAQFGYREIVEHDVPALVDETAARFSGRPLYLLGHSLGGQLASLAAVHVASSVAGLILVASGTAHHRAWPSGQRWLARCTVAAIRVAARVLPWYPGRRLGFGGDQPRRLMRDWGYNAATGRYRCVGSQVDYDTALGEVALPVLSVEIRGDLVAPSGAAAELLRKLCSCTIERRQIDSGGADTPWRRHFSWAKQPAETVAAIAQWLRAAEPCRGTPPVRRRL